MLAIYRYRLLSSQQIEALFFPSTGAKPHSRRSACQRRLQLLFHHGFLDRLSRPLIMGEGRAPFVYALATNGADLVARTLGVDRGNLEWKPKENEIGALFLEHTLAINDFNVVVTSLAQQERWKVEKWIGDHAFRSKLRNQVPVRMRGARKIRVLPDGYFAIRFNPAKPAGHLFLEVDRGTMSNTRWQGKVEAYVQFRTSDRAVRHYQTSEFRILTVTSGHKRLENLKKATENAGGGVYFWFTTEEQIDIWQPERLLRPIWRVAGSERTFALYR